MSRQVVNPSCWIAIPEYINLATHKLAYFETKQIVSSVGELNCYPESRHVFTTCMKFHVWSLGVASVDEEDLEWQK